MRKWGQKLIMKLDNTLYSYKQIRDKLLKYKKEYEKDMELIYAELLLRKKSSDDVQYIKGHLHMINMLLDDLDSNSGIGWLGIDLSKDEEVNN